MHRYMRYVSNDKVNALMSGCVLNTEWIQHEPSVWFLINSAAIRLCYCRPTTFCLLCHYISLECNDANEMMMIIIIMMVLLG